MKQTKFEPSLVAEEAGKGLEKARDVHMPIELTPSHF